MEQIKDIAKKTLENSLSLFVLDKVGIFEMANDNNTIKRNIKRGTVFYLSDQLIEEALTQNSNLRRMNLNELVDDVFYDSIASFGLEQLGTFGPVSNFVSDYFQDNETSKIISSAVIMTAVQKLPEFVDVSLIRNISNKIF
jgi:hypothetical protein